MVQFTVVCVCMYVCVLVGRSQKGQEKERRDAEVAAGYAQVTGCSILDGGFEILLFINDSDYTDKTLLASFSL